MISRRSLLAQSAALSLSAYAAKSSLLSAPWEKQSALPRAMDRVASGSNVAATVNPVASEAAAKMFSQGGNAIDAAIAAALCLSVVDGHNSGIGGGCFILIRLADGSLQAIDGRETAPALSHKDMFLRNGTADVKLSQDGPLACGVPGFIAALHSAHQRFGKLPWGDLFEPAIRAAAQGHTVTNSTYQSIKNEADVLRRFPASASILLKPDGSFYQVGETLIQSDLAKTLSQIAKKGRDWFYQGEFAERCAKHIREQGGLLSKADFAAYQAKDRKPLRYSYRGHEIIGFPTPSSGGIHIQQMLQMLSRFSLTEIDPKGRSARFYHLLAEAMKLAFADRAFYLGDADYVEVPSFLTDSSYTDELARRIDLNRATDVPGHMPTNANGIDDGKKHTTHMTTADANGNWVALTATVNTGWGNKMIVPGTGVVLNDEMDDFSISPGVPNAFGLIGSHANAVEPGKRPLSSMSPTIVLNESGEPVLTCGAAGGPRIINATLQVVIRSLDFQMSIGDALAESRVHHQWQPNILSCEGGLGGPFQRTAPDNSLIKELQAMGHQAKPHASIAIAQGIQRAKDSKSLIAACDPRSEGRAVVWH
jgi:gamma-glutamyltranspeptidase / glutathione hydrolase